jgi:hypothetical protein
MRELISSMMRFSAAVTMFGIEQAQNAISAPADTQAAIAKLRASLDSMSDSLASKMDDSKRAALDSMSKAQADVVNRAFDAADLEAAQELMKKTSQSLADVMSRSAKAS